MNIIRKIALLLLFLLPLYSFSQDFEFINPEQKPIHDKSISELSPLEILEDSLYFYADSMYYSPMPEYRVQGNYEFIRIFKNLLKTPNSFNFPFNKLKEKITILNAPDNSFKIYNWEILRSGSDHRYYGAIQLTDGSFIPLVDVSDQIIRGIEDSIFTGTRWYGCLYYNIIQKEIGGQNIYFLLGWNGNSMNSEKKIIEVFGFNSKGQSQFGAPLFSTLERGKRFRTNRFVMEYQKGAKISLNLDPNTNQIVFDHCESQIGDPAKKYTYIPDGTYDGFSWDGQQWVMTENIVQIEMRQNGEVPLEKPIK